MTYLLIGLAVSIGWHIGDLLVTVIWNDILGRRVASAKWYRRLTNREEKSDKFCDERYSERKIGF